MMETEVTQYAIGLDQAATRRLNNIQPKLWKHVIFLAESVHN